MTVITPALDDAVRRYVNDEITSEEYFQLVGEEAVRNAQADLAAIRAQITSTPVGVTKLSRAASDSQRDQPRSGGDPLLGR